MAEQDPGNSLFNILYLIDPFLTLVSLVAWILHVNLEIFVIHLLPLHMFYVFFHWCIKNRIGYL